MIRAKMNEDSTKFFVLIKDIEQVKKIGFKFSHLLLDEPYAAFETGFVNSPELEKDFFEWDFEKINEHDLKESKRIESKLSKYFNLIK